VITQRTLIATIGAATAALIAMAWLSFARAGAEQVKAREGGLDAAIGKAMFERLWVGAPASTDAADGLGPLFNARSCAACHQGGRAARLVTRDGTLTVHGLVVRAAATDGLPHPELGRQIQDRALPGLAAEARVSVRLEGGALRVSTRLHAEPDVAAIFETRLAPSLHGRALLDEIEEAAVLALADPEDRDGDGISGRPHMVRDAAENTVPGRFGAKAMVASLDRQSAEAAALDLGLSSPLVPHAAGDCTALQAECRARPTGRSAISEGEEVSSEVIRLIVDYLKRLDPPPVDTGSAGFRLFASIGCASCHVPSLPGRDGRPKQVFTDLLLHDLGAEGASLLREGHAEPAEWRTAPLRDLDPRKGSRRYLHDGRAATLQEAIAHHGGEGAGARAAFTAADGPEQQLLLDFLSRL
jgi:CxxC motif-containing protein (DUF1111 family)